MKKNILLALLIIFLAHFSAFSQNETITISTYYPSPTGVYNNLRLFPIADVPVCDVNGEGTMYYDNNTNGVMLCQETSAGVFTWQNIGAGFWTQAGTSLYPNDTNWNMLVGTDTALANGRVQIADPSVPLVVTETDTAVTGGGLWRMSLDGGIVHFDTNTALGGDFSSNISGVLSMVPDAPGGRVGVRTLAPQVDLDINNTLRLVPVSASSYNLEGGLYYDSDDHRLKYRDNTGWKNIGAVLGTAYLKTGVIVDRPNPPTWEPDVNCGANEVMVGIRVTCRNECPNDCGFHGWSSGGGRIYQVSAWCAPLQ
jgi:hypothetical protein